MKTYLLTFLLFLSILCNSCTRKPVSIPPVKLHRYEQALMQISPDSISYGLKAIQKEFPLYLEGADLNDTLNLLRISNFITDPIVIECYKKINETYKSGKQTEETLAKAFALTRSIFPHFKNPTVFTYISYFDYMNRILYLDSILSISLELYLNGNDAFYNSVGIPRYISSHCIPEYLVPDVMRSIATRLIRKGNPSSNLLEEIIYQGKILFFLNEVLPEVSNEIKLAYTPEQLSWSETHEKEVWQYLMKENLLYETNLFKVKYFVNDGPGNLLFDGAPPRLTQYLGWQIVKKYMKKHKNNWNSLLQEPAQKILKESSYKP